MFDGAIIGPWRCRVVVLIYESVMGYPWGIGTQWAARRESFKYPKNLKRIIIDTFS
nr:MAG TPA: hypothetical protein [Caudoviricetes sp.]